MQQWVQAARGAAGPASLQQDLPLHRSGRPHMHWQIAVGLQSTEGTSKTRIVSAAGIPSKRLAALLKICGSGLDLLTCRCLRGSSRQMVLQSCSPPMSCLVPRYNVMHETKKFSMQTGLQVIVATMGGRCHSHRHAAPAKRLQHGTRQRPGRDSACEGVAPVAQLQA